MTAQWPTVTVSAAFQNTTDFILDDFTNGVLDTSVVAGPAWSDLSADVRGFTTTRGRQTSLDRFSPGTLTVDLDDSPDSTTGKVGGAYDPDNLSGPYVLHGASLIQPLVPVRVTATWNSISYPIYYGFVDSWTPQYTPGRFSYQSTQVAAQDAMNILASFVPAAPSVSQGANETADARINRVLNNAQADISPPVPPRLLDPGEVPLEATTLAQSAYDDIQAAVDAELGVWYVMSDGTITFRRRHARVTDPKSRVSQAVWSDRTISSGPYTTNLVYGDVARVNDFSLVRNYIQGQRSGGTLQTVRDLISEQLTQGPRTYNATSLLLTSDPAVDSWCQLVRYLYSRAESRITSVTFSPLSDPTNLWLEVLRRKIGDQVTVVVHPPAGDTVIKPCFIEGISHTVGTTPASWSTTFYLSSASRYAGGWFILDDFTNGVLDTSTLGG